MWGNIYERLAYLKAGSVFISVRLQKDLEDQSIGFIEIQWKESSE